MTEASSPVFRVIPTVQSYDWGKPGYSSKVVQLLAASSLQACFQFDKNSPYAELWMGTHTSSPSRVHGRDGTLSDHLRDHPQLLGPRVAKKFEGNLPFLLKVLSVEKSLSIQVHPDKATAEKLHQTSPKIYKDANHKPEMAIALTPFTALCGFRPLPQIATYLRSTPEFSSLISPEILTNFHEQASVDASSPQALSKQKSALKLLFVTVMTAPSECVSKHLSALMERYSSAQNVHDNEKDIFELVKTLNSQFPGDVGVFCAFMLNYVTLTPGQAIFLGAGEPHAYISGDIVECMANSDNVIRAGLTPKLRDVPNLIANLTYNAGGCEAHMVEPVVYDGTATLVNDSGTSRPQSTLLYDPPIPEFSILRTELGTYSRELTHRAIDGPSVCIVTEGTGQVRWAKEGKGISWSEDGQVVWDADSESAENKMSVRRGDVLFIGAGWDVEFCMTGFHPIVVFRAFVTAS